MMKTKKKAKYMVVKITTEDPVEMVIDSVADASAGKGQEGFEEFVGTLPPTESRYLVYDFDFQTDDGRPQDKLMFITWNPDDGAIKQKMLYSSSKDALKKKLVGFAKELNATDFDEISYEEVLAKAKAK